MKIVCLLALICLSVFADNKDIVVNADLFLENFYHEAFGIDLHLDTCERDASNIVQVVNEAVHMVTDFKDVKQFVAAAEHLIDNKDMFMNTYQDCKTCGPDFVKGGLALKPLAAPGAAANAVEKAALHHPIGFPKNLL